MNEDAQSVSPHERFDLLWSPSVVRSVVCLLNPFGHKFDYTLSPGDEDVEEVQNCRRCGAAEVKYAN